jgi:hypothetical protein
MTETKCRTLPEAVKLALNRTPIGGWMAFHYIRTAAELEPWHVNDSTCPCYPFAIERQIGQTVDLVVKAYEKGKGH